LTALKVIKAVFTHYFEVFVTLCAAPIIALKKLNIHSA
jgi:hypothetical protein